MKSTDKYYEISQECAFSEQSRIIKALSLDSEKHNMTMEDINALARFLAWRRLNGDDCGQYEHVVDYLWMSFRIGLNAKMLLLDLISD